MKHSLLALVVALPIFAVAEQGPTCWETLRKTEPGISQNFACVVEKAGDLFASICSQDGIGVTNDFKAYLFLQGQYQAAKAQADAWLAANPGASQYPPKIAANLKNAENRWMVAGKRYQIEDQIEKIRRQSVSCK